MIICERCTRIKCIIFFTGFRRAFELNANVELFLLDGRDRDVEESYERHE